MAKTSSVVKNNKRKKTVEKYAKRRAELKEIIRSPKTSAEERETAFAELFKQPRNASATRYRKRCSISGRSRGYMGRFGLSRIEFREAASKGFIPGLTKASW